MKYREITLDKMLTIKVTEEMHKALKKLGVNISMEVRAYLEALVEKKKKK